MSGCVVVSALLLHIEIRGRQDVRRQEGISYHSDLESRRRRTRARLRKVACWMERPLAGGEGGGTQLPRRSAKIEAQAPGTHSFTLIRFAQTPDALPLSARRAILPFTNKVLRR